MTQKFESASKPAHQIKGRAIKCVVWDLDNTLWNGILSENDELVLREDLVDVIKTLDARGILHSIASRNDFEPAREQLERFGILDYFLYPQISWGPKSEAVQTVAQKLNLGIEAFAFVDDQPFELGEVQHQVPEVMCIPVEDAPNLPDYPPFQPRFVTDDSKLRRLMYMQDQSRLAAEEDYSGTNEDFLNSLSLVMTIGPAAEADLQRAEELTVRTHQLNSTGRFYSYEQLNQMRYDDRYQVLIVGLEDRFGVYGKIGLVVVETLPDAWTIKLILMSCRVVSRGVGGVVLAYLKNTALDAGARLMAEFLPTDRNRMMYVTLKFNGYREIEEVDGVKILENDSPERLVFPSYMAVNPDE